MLYPRIRALHHALRDNLLSFRKRLPFCFQWYHPQRGLVTKQIPDMLFSLPLPLHYWFETRWFPFFGAPTNGSLLSEMNTWASATYSISSSLLPLFRLQIESSVFINNVSLRIDEKSGMPIVQRKYPKFVSSFVLMQSDLKELERIEEGDVVYCFNSIAYRFHWRWDVFFSSFADYEAQTLTLARLLSSEKWFNLKLLDIHLLAWVILRHINFRRQGVPRIEQIIIPDTRVTVRLSQFACSLSTCISSISS